MDIRDLELSRPCPIDLDSLGVDRSQRQIFCSHCSSEVTDISKMTAADAAEFVAANRGKGVCISYTRDDAGRVRFADVIASSPDQASSVGSSAPALVPVERLRRPRLRRAAAVAAIALAACTPHAEHDDPVAEGVDEIMMQRSEAAIPIVVADAVEDVVVEEDVVEEDVVDDVRLEGAAVQELPEIEDVPCEGKAATDRPRVRGQLKKKVPAQPKRTQEDWSVVDGGI